IISGVGPIISGWGFAGYMKFSSDGFKIAYANYSSNYVAVFDFDPYSGTVSNEQYITIPNGNSGPYGIEFSNTGNYLYGGFASTPGIFQWDISSTDTASINASANLIGTTSTLSAGAFQI